MLLNDKRIKAVSLGNFRMGSHGAVGVGVWHPDYETTALFFDKQTGLLIKSKTRTKHEGKEVTEEIEFSDYKSAGGILIPRALGIRRDGNIIRGWKITELRLFTQTLGPMHFNKP